MDKSLFLGWGIDSSSGTTPVLNQSFDDQTLHGIMSMSTAEIQGNIYIGQVWDPNAVGPNDTLTINGYTSMEARLWN